MRRLLIAPFAPAAAIAIARCGAGGGASAAPNASPHTASAVPGATRLRGVVIAVACSRLGMARA
jgi:hypothetical protein